MIDDSYNFNKFIMNII